MDTNQVRTQQETKMQEKETLDEKLPGLFEPDTLLPIQYFEAMRRKHLLEGEKRLILSVLEDAIECFMKCIDATTSKGQRLFREAEEWINLEDKHWVFSFDNVCDMLDINPDYMRAGLRRWKEKHVELKVRREQEMAAQEAARALEQEALPESEKLEEQGTAEPKLQQAEPASHRKTETAMPSRRTRPLRKARA